MSATERFRQLLDDRGVEWMGTSYTKPTQGHPTNTSLAEEHHNAVFTEYFDGSVLRLFDLTPEQAVAATLGRGTCRMCKRKGYDREHLHHYECSECGEEVLRSSVMGKTEPPKFCPECGRRVEE